MVLSASFGFAKDEGRDVFTQEKLARELVNRMGLEVSAGAPAQEYFSALEQRGITPPDGWQGNKEVAREDLERILIDAGRLQAEAKAEGKNEGIVLKERGVVLPEKISEKTLDSPEVNTLLQVPLAEIAGAAVPIPGQALEIQNAQIVPPPPDQAPPKQEDLKKEEQQKGESTTKETGKQPDLDEIEKPPPPDPPSPGGS
jgi:hypothetical protein